MHPLLSKALLRVGVFYAYGLFIAWIFTLIERRDESAHDRMSQKLKKLRTEINLKYNMTDNDFDFFVRRAAEVAATEEGLDWTFLNSCGFAFAAITTIGFGNLTPKTRLGQGLTIIACIIGIPITMLALKTAGELLACCIRFAVVKTEAVILKRAEPEHLKKKMFTVTSTLLVVLLILASVASTFLDEWTFLEGLYVWFVTFTTIGFGDYVSLESIARKVDHGETSKIYLVLYGALSVLPYLIGLSLMSCLLTCVVDSIDHIRDFRDQYIMKYARRLLCCGKSSYDVKRGEGNQEYCTSQD